ncbi:MAG: metallophosphoesterase, partial [Lachnospiraceae bacterium]|nr:metallophosphoesterase [Lachnospiraceae bacterium]
FCKGPVLYVHGNHDESYATKPPEGCTCIEDMVYDYNGVRILGLGGSMRYREGTHQYNEREMDRRIRRVQSKIRRKKGFDIILTHAPACGIHDQSDLPHHGFHGFLDLMDQYRPRYMIHGHVHMNYGYNIERTSQYHDTTVINSYEKYLIEL